MRSPQQIQSRLEVEPEYHNRNILIRALRESPEQLAFHISDVYEKAFINALRHRPNAELTYNFATLTWLAGSDLNVVDMPWIQFGMPRIRQMAKELKLPFPYVTDGSVALRAKRMANGLTCLDNCVRCHRGR